MTTRYENYDDLQQALYAEYERNEDVWQYQVIADVDTFRHNDQIVRYTIDHERRLIFLQGIDESEDE